jgi:hypothetical protein
LNGGSSERFDFGSALKLHRLPSDLLHSLSNWHSLSRLRIHPNERKQVEQHRAFSRPSTTGALCPRSQCLSLKSAVSTAEISVEMIRDDGKVNHL